MKGTSNAPVSIAMIVYNEAQHIERVLREYEETIFRKLPRGSEFVVYLDCGTDGSDEIVKRLAKPLGLTVIQGEKNLGYAGALAAALGATRHELVFFSDSSGKHVAQDFWRLYERRDDADIVNGLRSSRSDPLVRRVLTLCSRTLISFLFFVPFHDFNTGYKLLHRRALDAALPACSTRRSMLFSSELLIRARKQGFTIIDVPVTFQKRAGKNSGISYRHLPRMILRSVGALTRLRWALWRRRSNVVDSSKTRPSQAGKTKGA